MYHNAADEICSGLVDVTATEPPPKGAQRLLQQRALPAVRDGDEKARIGALRVAAGATKLPVDLADQLGQGVGVPSSTQVFKLSEAGARELCRRKTGTGSADAIAHNEQAISFGQVVLIDLPGVFTLHVVWRRSAGSSGP